MDAKDGFLVRRLHNLGVLLTHLKIFAPSLDRKSYHHRSREYIHFALDIHGRPVKFSSPAQDLHRLREDLRP